MSAEYERIYIRFKGRVLGPLTGEKAAELVKRGQITKQHELSADGVEWRPATEFAYLFPKEPAAEKRTATVQQRTEAVASTDTATPVVQKTEWYANFDGVNEGPVDERTLRSWIMMGKVSRTTQIWRTGMADWQQAAVVEPSWFPMQSNQGRGSHGSEGADDSTFALDARILVNSHPWVLFLSIVGILIGVVSSFGSIYLFFKIATADGSGPPKVVAVFMSLIHVTSCIAWLLASLQLLRYANRLSVLKYRRSEIDFQRAFLESHRFWFFCGICVLILLIVFSMFIAMVVLLDLSIPYRIFS